MKLNYFIISSFSIGCALIGSYFTTSGLAWYKTLNVPTITPPDYIFSIVWTAIYTLTTLCALYLWNKTEKIKNLYGIFVGFIINGILNAAWSFFFFYRHMIGIALLDAIALEFSTITLLILVWRQSKGASLLLIPYVLWGAFAIILNILIYLMN